VQKNHLAKIAPVAIRERIRTRSVASSFPVVRFGTCDDRPSAARALCAGLTSVFRVGPGDTGCREAEVPCL
jgi:hypothetical protein